MVVVVKASVAAEQLEKALMAANKTPGMRCNCKPGKDTSNEPSIRRWHAANNSKEKVLPVVAAAAYQWLSVQWRPAVCTLNSCHNPVKGGVLPAIYLSHLLLQPFTMGWMHSPAWQTSGTPGCQIQP